MDVFELIKKTREKGCSDLHITAGTAIAVRRYGELSMLDDKPTLQESTDMILQLISDEADKEYVLAGHDLDICGSTHLYGCMSVK